jgi:hypothetical protein
MPDHPAPGQHRLGLHLIPDEPDQVLRLRQFRTDHPDVTILPGQFRTWEARVLEADGETTIVRHTLRELLDRLVALLGDVARDGGGIPVAGRQEGTP